MNKRFLSMFLALLLCLALLPATAAEDESKQTSNLDLSEDTEAPTAEPTAATMVRVVFNATGGTWLSSFQSMSWEMEYEYGKTYKPFPMYLTNLHITIDPQKDGFVFLGWFTEPEGGEQVFESTIIQKKEKHTLYAHWWPEGEPTPTPTPTEEPTEEPTLEPTATPTAVPTEAPIEVEATIRFDEGEVEYKGTTPYVIWNYDRHEPGFTVVDEDGNVIDPSYYTYEYQENRQAGTGYIFVYFNAPYTGELKQFFKIYLPATTETAVENVENGIKISWAPVEDAAGYVIYRRAWNLVDAGWTTFERWNNTTDLEWIDTKVYAGTRYQYGVKAYFARRLDPVAGAEIGGNVGDNFNLGMVGPLKTTVRITTRKLSSVTAGTRKMTVKWEGSKVFTGYQIQYALDSKFIENVKTVKIADAATYSKVIKKLTTGKKYYVRVRSYHLFEGMTYYGQWSNVKSCKVK